MAVAVAVAVLVVPWVWLGRAGHLTTRPAGAAVPSATDGSGPIDSTGAAASAVPDPYAVGILTVALVDPTRETPARGATPASSSRALTVTIRYPSIGSAGGAEVAAAPAVGGRFPLVVFAHGFNAWADMYDQMQYELAAAGFVVAAPDFPLSSAALDGPAIRDAVEQASDVSFVISSLLDPATAPSQLRRAIADTRVGVIGQSDGAVTAAGIAFNDEYRDPRVGAAVVLTGAEIFFPGRWFTDATAALLAIHGTADETNPFGASQQLYDHAVGTTRYLVSVIGGSHNGPFTTDPIRSQISLLIADFLRAELLADRDARARVVTGAELPGALTLITSD